jgi:hypothetical protein
MKPNRLIHEKSPYLLQHAQNPVDWYPWCPEAFARAAGEDKPVFLSIGYSTCHWCHVMERESFEDEDVAALLNDTFINIKVDREERPDIDAVYMEVCQLMTQGGGWPLTIMMTPEQKPFFAATYIPRENRYGRTGMLELIPRVRSLWREKRAALFDAAAEITHALRRPLPEKGRDLSEDTLHHAFRSLTMSFDAAFGGFGRAPKFPTPHHLFFLLRYWRRTGNAQALHIVEHTLRNMRHGGIYDHIGFGFHRYSTDARWKIPHFEKMLYDQALMAIACIELYQATEKKIYERTAREIFGYVLSEMTDEQGGFYCAEDADSEGVEGKFYLWSEEEILRVLNQEEADWFLSAYRHDVGDATTDTHEIPAGHFLPRLQPPDESGQDDIKPCSRREVIRLKLFAAREKRTHPHRDDKILADWNGLMIAALARGARVLNEPSFAEAAGRAMNFILTRMQTGEGRLLHRYRKGEAAIPGNVDDYSFVIWALLELYEATFATPYLQSALQYHDDLFHNFLDEKNGGLFFTSSDAEELLTRPKIFYDGAIPSGNSVAYLNTLKLARITGNADMEKRAHEIYKAFCAQAGAMPTGFTQFLCGLDFAIGPANEVVITGNRGASDTQAMLAALRKHFMPNTVVLFRPTEPDEPDLASLSPRIRSYPETDGRATAYVCSHFTCAPPTADPETLVRLLHPKTG